MRSMLISGGEMGINYFMKWSSVEKIVGKFTIFYEIDTELSKKQLLNFSAKT